MCFRVIFLLFYPSFSVFPGAMSPLRSDLLKTDRRITDKMVINVNAVINTSETESLTQLR